MGEAQFSDCWGKTDLETGTHSPEAGWGLSGGQHSDPGARSRQLRLSYQPGMLR